MELYTHHNIGNSTHISVFTSLIQDVKSEPMIFKRQKSLNTSILKVMECSNTKKITIVASHFPQNKLLFEEVCLNFH